MGTRGLKIVRFRGRYFVYWNQFDSYPEGLGKELVNQIPVNPEEYQQWLENKRATYAQMTAVLEGKVLTVTEEMMVADVETAAQRARCLGRQDEKPERYLLVDDRLYELPTALACKENDLWIEWMYTIDLDRELFSVNMEIHFDLSNIPRERWIKAFECRGEESDRGEAGGGVSDGGASDGGESDGREPDGRELDSGELVGGDLDGGASDGREPDSGELDGEDPGDEEPGGGEPDGGELGGKYQLFSFKICPEGKIIQPVFPHFNIQSRLKYEAAYKEYDCSMVRVRNQIENSSRVAHGQTLRVLLLEEFMSDSFPLNEYLPSWNYQSFAFRELTFAVLSIAAGQYRFRAPKKLDGDISNGYLIDRNGGGLELVPLFGGGCHSPGKEAGSAPEATIYWLENILVSLVSDHIIQNNVEAAIAQLVEFGLGEGKNNFYAVVFSLCHAVTLQVLVKNGVTTIKRTSATGLYHPSRARRQEGFISLISFFNFAADRYLSAFSQGRLPTEIYERILSNTDEATYITCAKVSRTFRAICQEKTFFDKHLMITKISHNHDAEHQFTFLNLKTGGIMDVDLMDSPSHAWSRVSTTSWSPIIGMDRPSIISQVQLFFPTQSMLIRKGD